MRKLMIIISMAFIVIAARGQSVLRGRVSQQDSGMPLAGVNVKVSGTDLGTVTDNAGDFTLRLADGSYRLAFSHIGNLSTEVFVRMPLQDTLKVALTMGERQLSEVTVHTGYQKIELSRATGSYNVIAGDLLERRVSACVLPRNWTD